MREGTKKHEGTNVIINISCLRAFRAFALLKDTQYLSAFPNFFKRNGNLLSSMCSH